MNILSLFDGMSCGQIALERAEIKYDTYYASEIDKYAIQITQKNYPNTIQLGDIKDISTTSFPKFTRQMMPKMDLIMGGSPCQGFSISGKRLDFKDPRSELFFKFARIVKENKPRYFLLENVRMKQECQDVISEYLGVKPVKINSALVSAQNRVRLYWTNLPIPEIEDKHIYLKDIIEEGCTDRDKSLCIDANYFKGGNLKQYFEKHRRQPIISNSWEHNNFLINKPIRIGEYGKGGQGQRVYDIRGKSVTLSALGGGWGAKTGLYYVNAQYRKLSPIECERLQTVPDNYTEGVSNTQRYKMLGNGWTVDVIVEFLKGIKK